MKAQKILNNNLGCSTILEERQGFEPWEGITLNGFQDRRFKPLSHLSIQRGRNSLLEP